MTKSDDESEKTGGIPVSNLMSQALRELRLPENESQVSNAPVSTPALSARTEQVRLLKFRILSLQKRNHTNLPIRLN